MDSQAGGEKLIKQGWSIIYKNIFLKKLYN